MSQTTHDKDCVEEKFVHGKDMWMISCVSMDL